MVVEALAMEVLKSTQQLHEDAISTCTYKHLVTVILNGHIRIDTSLCKIIHVYTLAIKDLGTKLLAFTRDY